MKQKLNWKRMFFAAFLMVAIAAATSISIRETMRLHAMDRAHERARLETMKRITYEAAMVQARWEAGARARKEVRDGLR